MVQFSLPAMLDLALCGEFSPRTVVHKMCHAQADIFGIQGRGYIREGYAADLVHVNPDAETVVDKEIILSKCGWSPLEGERLRSKIIRTWVNGRQVYDSMSGVREDVHAALPLRFGRR